MESRLTHSKHFYETRALGMACETLNAEPEELQMEWENETTIHVKFKEEPDNHKQCSINCNSNYIWVDLPKGLKYNGHKTMPKVSFAEASCIPYPLPFTEEYKKREEDNLQQYIQAAKVAGIVSEQRKTTEVEEIGQDTIECAIFYKCKNCGCEYVLEGDNYCSNCSAKIIWRK